jgi:competence protein ComEC
VFKDKFKETTRKFISSPQQGLLEALFFGDEENISKEWKNKINTVGVRHIAAVSGMNITIISSLILSFALGLGMWRKQAFYFSIILIILYILMIGAPASAVRAGILGGLFMLGQHLGRFSAASRAIVSAAAFMLLLNPLLLKIDIGFQLSFLAMLGIIYLQPIFSNVFKKIPNPNIFPLSSTLSTTLAAQVLTMPILIYNFGYISSVSPITNILIVPIISPLTIIIFLFGLSAMIFLPLGFILSWLVWLSLTYIVFIINLFSKVTFAMINIQNLNLFLGLVYYFCIILLILWWRRREQNKLLNY